MTERPSDRPSWPEDEEAVKEDNDFDAPKEWTNHPTQPNERDEEYPSEPEDEDLDAFEDSLEEEDDLDEEDEDDEELIDDDDAQYEVDPKYLDSNPDDEDE